MKKRNLIFPVSVLEQSELSLYKMGRYAPHLYRFILLLIALTIASLFFIKVDVSVKTTGLIKPKGEKVFLTSPIAGRIQFKNFVENRVVHQGDTLFVIQADLITVSHEELEARKTELMEMISDLTGLCASFAHSPKTAIYRQELYHYRNQATDYRQKIEIANSKYKRNKLLLAEHLIPQAEAEQSEFEYDNAKVAASALATQQRSQWEAVKTQHENELREIDTKLDQMLIQVSDAVVVASTDGVIQKISNIQDGAYVHASQQMAELSPEGDLLVECYVTPRDIGLLAVGMRGKFQIDAFNYNDWGMLEGEIVEIFNDIQISSEGKGYYYKVYCQLDSHELHLKNGYTGYVKKGMTANTRFIVTRRTLFQLLYDKVDDWLNPNLKTEVQ